MGGSRSTAAISEASVHDRGDEDIYERFGGVDVLVNNAGIGMRTVNPRFLTDPQPFWAVAPRGFSDVLDTKVTGCFLVARDVVPRMLATGGGRIVTISMNEQTVRCLPLCALASLISAASVEQVSGTSFVWS